MKRQAKLTESEKYRIDMIRVLLGEEPIYFKQPSTKLERELSKAERINYIRQHPQLKNNYH